jgi:hypothetical protein
MRDSKPISFRVVLAGVPNTAAAVLPIPFDAHAIFGVRGRVPVRGTVNGVPFRSSIFPGRAYSYRHLILPRAAREAASVKAGDTVDATIELDEAPREVALPADLAQALQAEPVAQMAWEQLSYTRRKEQVASIEGVTKPETRARKIERLVGQLAAGKKPGRR